MWGLFLAERLPDTGVAVANMAVVVRLPIIINVCL